MTLVQLVFFVILPLSIGAIGVICGEKFRLQQMAGLGVRSVSKRATSEIKPRAVKSARFHHAIRYEAARMAQIGIDRYQSLRPYIEPNHLNEYIAISIKTGRFAATPEGNLEEFAQSLDLDDFLWVSRIGHGVARK
jgi:hypothetical protein